MVVDIERQVVQVEEPQPVLLGDGRMAAVRVELIGNPHVQYHVEGNARVGEVLGHDVLSKGIRSEDSKKYLKIHIKSLITSSPINARTEVATAP